MRTILIACLLLVSCGGSGGEQLLPGMMVRQRYAEAVCTHVSTCETGIEFDSCMSDLDLRLESDMEQGWPQPTTEADMATCEEFIESIDCATRPRPSIWWSIECNFGQP